MVIVCFAMLLLQGVTPGKPLKKTRFERWYEAQVQGQVGQSTVEVSGKVVQRVERGTYQVLYLNDSNVDFMHNSMQSSQILVYDKNKMPIYIGNQVKVSGKLELFEDAHNPGNFSQRFYNLQQGIEGYLWTEDIQILTSEKEYLKEGIFRLKSIWRGYFCKLLGEDEGSLFSALLFGERQGVDPDTKEIYQKGGIGHLLAISGTHVSFIGLGIYKIIRKGGVPFWLSGMLALVGLFFFLQIAGNAAAVIRALIMVLFRIGADISGRAYDIWTAWFVSALCIVIGNPLQLYDVGFLLSFGAILGMMVASVITSEIKCVKKNRILKEIIGNICIHMMLFPIVLYYYYEQSTYSVLVNCILLSAMNWILLGGFAGSISILIPNIISDTLLKCCAFLLRLFEWICEISLELPYARIVYGRPKFWQIAMYYMILAILLWSVKLKSKKWLLGLCALLLIDVMQPIKEFGNVEVTMINVGQGDGLFIKGPNGNTYLIDAGSTDVSNVGKYRIEPYLKYKGIKSIDYAFLTHADADHINGVIEMLQRKKLGIDIRALILSEKAREDVGFEELKQTARENGSKIYYMEEGSSLQEGEMRIVCLAPNSGDKIAEGNESSMVLSLEYKEFDMLFTGDVEGHGEKLLIEKLEEKKYDVLKVAHHGSKNATPEAFLEIIEPVYACISAGKNNRYGHPHQEVIERLEAYTQMIWKTNEHGAIEIWTDGRIIKIDGK